MAASSSKTVISWHRAPLKPFVFAGEFKDKGKTAKFEFRFNSKVDFPVKKGKPVEGEVVASFEANSFGFEWIVDEKVRYRSLLSDLPSSVLDTPNLEFDTGIIKVVVSKDKGTKWVLADKWKGDCFKTVEDVIRRDRTPP